LRQKTTEGTETLIFVSKKKTPANPPENILEILNEKIEISHPGQKMSFC